MGQEDGFGVEDSPDVGSYAGKFSRGTYEGYGVVRNPDQQVYAGQWRDAREHVRFSAWPILRVLFGGLKKWRLFLFCF
jgi:hypothetical protein